MNETQIAKLRAGIARFEAASGMADRASRAEKLLGYVEAILDSYETTEGSEEEDVLVAAGLPRPTEGEVLGDRRLRGQRVCSFCGVQGHNAKGCEDKKKIDEALQDVTEPDDVVPPEPEDTLKEPSDPLTREHFDQMKKFRDGGLNALQVKNRLGEEILLIEVNRAWSAPNYDYYLAHRLR